MSNALNMGSRGGFRKPLQVMKTQQGGLRTTLGIELAAQDHQVGGEQ
jgi:hypothetical protein